MGKELVFLPSNMELDIINTPVLAIKPLSVGTLFRHLLL